MLGFSQPKVNFRKSQVSREDTKQKEEEVSKTALRDF